VGIIVLVVFGIIVLGIVGNLLKRVSKRTGSSPNTPFWKYMIGVPVAIAGWIERILRPMRVRFLAGAFFVVLYLCISAVTSDTDPPRSHGRFGTVAFVLAMMLLTHLIRTVAQRSGEPVALRALQDRDFYTRLFAVVVFSGIAAFLSLFESNAILLIAGGYWLIAMAYGIYFAIVENVTASRYWSIRSALSKNLRFNGTAYLARMSGKRFLTNEQGEVIYRSVVVKLVTAGKILEVELGGSTWLCNANWYKTAQDNLDRSLAAQPRYPEAEAYKLVKSFFHFSDDEAKEYVDCYLTSVRVYPFPEGDFVVHDLHAPLVKTCACCGSARSANDDAYDPAGWYCSDLCGETEKICETISDAPAGKFYADAAAAGMVLVAGAHAWDTNHRIVAAGGQGHGIAAERANHKIDTLLGKKTQLLGDNNAKHGPDRSANGRLIQTKYYDSARGSVESAFQGSNGQYVYLDDKGHPLQLEVPKDQYPAALKVMEEKIAKGQVPGVNDPTQAKDLLVKGHITYEQSRNIVKFGTFESLAFDISEGAVVGLGAASISFTVSACVMYVETKDARTAARAAAVQAASTFGKTVTVYVGAQQLHRLAGVQRLLSVVDARSFSPSVSNFLEMGLGVDGRNALSKALRGTIVTSVVLIAVTTGPDLIRLIRGRMSKAQFIKNLAVTSSGIAGGAIGSVVGGVAGASFGPIGVFVGRTIGGIAGGMAAAMIANKIAGAMMEEDRVKMIALIQRQIEYLARTFLLTSDELDALRENLDRSLTSDTVELLFASSNRRAYANSLIKPAVVAVVKQRPVAHITMDDVIDACEELAA
jgi:hypothetical protein